MNIITDSGHLHDEMKIADLILKIFRNNEFFYHMTEHDPLYGVLQTKDEVETYSTV